MGYVGMKYSLSALLASCVAVAERGMPQEAKVWGDFGHLTVCGLAYRNFTHKVRAVWQDLFQRSHGIDISPRHYPASNVGCLDKDSSPRKYPSDLDMFKGNAEKQVRTAGFRIADLMNRALDLDYTGSVAEGA